jgi:mRNA interferase RelE/StbE
MEYQLIIVDEKIWNKDILKIQKSEYENIRKKILLLKNFPNFGDIKKLSSYALADFRFRIGKYRVLFDVDEKNKKILLFRVLHRKDAYMI